MTVSLLKSSGLLLASAFMLGTGVARGQTPTRSKKPKLPTVAEIRAKLRAESLTTLSWGARDAGRSGRDELVPDLRRALVRLGRRVEAAKPGNSGVEWAAKCVLDGLIRLRGTVGPAELAPFAGDVFYSPMPMILMARHASEHEATLRKMFAISHSHEWAVAGNALARLKSKPFVTLVLKQLKLILGIAVVVPNAEFAPVPEGTWIEEEETEERPLRVLPPRTNYPPMPDYRLTPDRSKLTGKPEPVCPGPAPMFVVRRELSAKQSDPGGAVPGINQRNDDNLVSWLADLLGAKPEQIPLRRITEVEISWVDLATLQHKIAIEKTKVLGRFHSLVNRLKRDGWISERIVRDPVVDIYVSDMRLDTTIEIPASAGITVNPIAMVKAKAPATGGRGK